MQITMTQLNPRIGDLTNNYQLIRSSLEESHSVDLVVTPEMATVGYPPRDLVDWPYFIDQVNLINKKLISETQSTALLFGTLFTSSEGIHNGAILACQGQEIARIKKSLLPTYDVFDETRYFVAGHEFEPVMFKGVKLGINICEDAWTDRELWPERQYKIDPITELVKKGATHLINMSGSPYKKGKPAWRQELFTRLARHHRLPVWHVNQVGANDELIFSGGSLQISDQGRVISKGPLFEEALIPEGQNHDWVTEEAELEAALVLGLKDYLRKTGFSRVVIGLSGGIDSALVLCIAVRALGPEAVSAVAMPGPYSSDHSLSDAQELCHALKVPLVEYPINAMFSAMEVSFEENLKSPLEGIARQNAQARCRGQILMNLANHLGALVLNTANKSELAVGYCTLLGDLCGALAVLGDLTKDDVYRLSRWYQKSQEIGFPESIITKPPSAELAPDQKDEDNLPPYSVLDQLVVDYIECEKDPKEMIYPNLSAEEVAYWVGRIDQAEYKRRQAPPVLRVTSKSFGLGRRRPIAQSFKIRDQVIE